MERTFSGDAAEADRETVLPPSFEPVYLFWRYERSTVIKLSFFPVHTPPFSDLSDEVHFLDGEIFLPAPGLEFVFILL